MAIVSEAPLEGDSYEMLLSLCAHGIKIVILLGGVSVRHSCHECWQCITRSNTRTNKEQRGSRLEHAERRIFFRDYVVTTVKYVDYQTQAV